ncbi:protocadherin-10-like [Chiloscyllium plagiosum]|uniref:protocadherin-10-like n=1 Tax=Chiloscyllium plagiosum TaxID=36176 RepID=UPI001CB86B9B|nr:protocadherin-10-like [Chiloscyllium plagiosum]
MLCGHVREIFPGSVLVYIPVVRRCKKQDWTTYRHFYINIRPRTMIILRRTSFVLLLWTSNLVLGQIRYSIPEEKEHGAFVGNIAEDLKLNLWELLSRKFRLVSDERRQYMKVNMEDGVLFVNERIDREQICKQSSICSLSFQLVLDNPLEIHPVAVEILDINDNSPRFPNPEFLLQISESISVGARFPVESAYDPDVSTNTINTYQVSPNDQFGLRVQTRTDGTKSAELILEKPLDREQQSSFHLLLSAVDGGIPLRSGTSRISITVLDVNDNAPVFDHETYKCSAAENSPKGTFVITVHATDIDEGKNGELKYYFTSHVSQNIRDLFNLDPETGEITVQGVLDFEESNVYELDVEAVDNADAGMAGRTKVMVELIDTNDNAPVLDVTLVSSTVQEDAPPGTVVALITAIDSDSGEYGHVECHIPVDIPFKLQRTSRNGYKLVTSDKLDRETVQTYSIHISVWDGGSPSLSTNKTLLVSISDINDNAPRFTQSSYNVYLMENNTPGASIFAVTAWDPDSDQNGEIIYSILNTRSGSVQRTSYVTISSKLGSIYALHAFDYEKLKHFQIKVQAQDNGSVKLSSTAFINVIILDQNDNAPVIVSPLTWNCSASVEILPQSVYPDYLVTKLIATDTDSGQNSRLSYHLLGANYRRLFTVGLRSGEIRATRRLREEEISAAKLIVFVKDNGEPSLSTTVTISFNILSNLTENSTQRTEEYGQSKKFFSNLNGYLIIMLGSTSLLLFVTIIVLVILKFNQDRNIAVDNGRTVCCCSNRTLNDTFNRTPAPNEAFNYTQSAQTKGYRYAISLSPESSKSDFLFLKPCNPPLRFNDLDVPDISTGK